MPFNEFEGARNFEELGSQIQAAVAREVNFDRFNVGLLDLDAYEFIDAYVYGRNVPGRQTGHRRTLKGTVVEAALASGGVFAGSDDVEAMVSRFPGFRPVYESGIKAMAATVICDGEEHIASLVVGSGNPQAFTAATIASMRLVGDRALSHLKRLSP